MRELLFDNADASMFITEDVDEGFGVFAGKLVGRFMDV